MTLRRAPATLIRLEKRLANDPCAILTATKTLVLDPDVRRVLVSPFCGRPKAAVC